MRTDTTSLSWHCCLPLERRSSESRVPDLLAVAPAKKAPHSALSHTNPIWQRIIVLGAQVNKSSGGEQTYSLSWQLLSRLYWTQTLNLVHPLLVAPHMRFNIHFEKYLLFQEKYQVQVIICTQKVLKSHMGSYHNGYTLRVQ